MPAATPAPERLNAQAAEDTVMGRLDATDDAETVRGSGEKTAAAPRAKAVKVKAARVAQLDP